MVLLSFLLAIAYNVIHIALIIGLFGGLAWLIGAFMSLILPKQS
jgi:hypothetical protein